MGFDQGGLLTDGIDQHPHSVLLLDEIEKAHFDLFNILLQIMDYGKFRYEELKKKNAARKKQKTIDVKEIKLRPNIDSHDYDVKMRSMRKFLDDGDKVKVTMRFRGREMAHQELGLNVLHRVRDELEKLSKIEQFPRIEGRQMVMVLAPK